ncbi:MAG TPA: kelch repeat-containing protein, partial [bacterium]|nr:kelch repeat-containing protein [bacterium]
ESWTELPNMLTPREDLQAVVLNGKIYVFGGNNAGNSLKSCEVFDPDTNRWFRLPDFTAPRGNFCTFTDNGDIWLVGGLGLPSTYYSSCEVYDPSAGGCSGGGQITQLPLTPISMLAGVPKNLILTADFNEGPRPDFVINTALFGYAGTTVGSPNEAVSDYLGIAVGPEIPVSFTTPTDTPTPTPEPEQGFRLELLNPGLVVQPGEQPRLYISVVPLGGFRENVDLTLTDGTVSHQLVPPLLRPPSVASLILEPVGADAVSGTRTIQVKGTSFIENPIFTEFVEQLDIEYSVANPLDSQSSLFVAANRSPISLGDSTELVGRLVPALDAADIVLYIELSEDGTVLRTYEVSARTNATGRFRYLFSPDEPGHYEINASWAGSEQVPPAMSEWAQLDVLPRKSRISLRVETEPPFQTGDTIHFSGRVSPSFEGLPVMAQVVVNYLSVSHTETYPVSFDGEDYSGDFVLQHPGVVRMTASWTGVPQFTEGSISPPVLFLVEDTAGGTSLQTASFWDSGVSVIVAGGSSTVLSEPTRDFLTNFSYSVLRSRRYNDLDLVYVNNNAFQDYNWDGQDDGIVDVTESSPKAIAEAFDTAAGLLTGSEPVSLFLLASEAQGTQLMMGDGTSLNAEALHTMIETKFGTQRDIRILVDASRSGTFGEALIAPNRTVMCSATHENASYAAGGLLSFAQLYWTKVQEGWGVKDSFQYARDYLNATFGYYGAPVPAMYPATAFDVDLLYYGLSSDATDMLAPVIEGVVEPFVLEGTREAEIFAWVTDDVKVESVVVSIVKPGGGIFSLPLQQSSPNSRKYAVRFSEPQSATLLNELGAYLATVVAMDSSRNCSEPFSTRFAVVSASDLGGDGKVDASDLLLIIRQLDHPVGLLDIYPDGRFDFKDFFLLARDWNP